jgi:addiction module HigA family antidote
MTSNAASGLPSTISKLLADDPSTPAPLHPGEALREDFMPHFSLSSSDVAQRLGVPVATVEGLLAEREPVTAELAVRLGDAFAQSPGYWRAMQLQYDLWRDKYETKSTSHVERSQHGRRPAA